MSWVIVVWDILQPDVQSAGDMSEGREPSIQKSLSLRYNASSMAQTPASHSVAGWIGPPCPLDVREGEDDPVL